MLDACLKVFEEEMSKSSPKEKLILDSYIPADGTYVIIDGSGTQKAVVDVKMDKKTRTVDRSSIYFPEICFYDYHSQLVSMNKPVDGKKIIHSNNYLSFFVKKDSIVSGKLTESIIDGYYDIMEDPINKKYNKSKEASEIYRLFEEQWGTVDREAVNEKRNWIKTHVFLLENVDMKRKDYLKIFFEAEYSSYEREDRRYLLPNIYNSNDYNVKIEGKVYGLPDNNCGMNSKKPFLSVKSRKMPSPYLLDGDRVMLQKQFFDYLLNHAAAGRYNIYVDTERMKILACTNGEVPGYIETGYYLRLRKGKEVEILNQDNIPGYSEKLNIPFSFKNVLETVHTKRPEYGQKYHEYYKRTEVGHLINEVFFSNWLFNQYFVDPEEIKIKDTVLKENIILARDGIFDWVYKGVDRGLGSIIDKFSLNLIKHSINHQFLERAMWQLNLRLSFREYFFGNGGESMAETISRVKESVWKKIMSDGVEPLENDREYYFAVGLLAGFLISLNKSKDRNQSLISPFMNARNDEVIKRRLLQLYKKYNYRLSDNYRRSKNLLAMTLGYVPNPKKGVEQETIILGYVCSNMMYTKEEK